MAKQEQESDDLAVNLSWPGGAETVRRPRATPEPVHPFPLPGTVPAGGEPRRTPAAAPLPSPPSPRPPVTAAILPAPSPAAPSRPRPRAAGNAEARAALVDIVEHLTTLSQLVTGTSRASAAETSALGDRLEAVVAELDELQVRVMHSLAGFDQVRLQVQKELADRPPLTDQDVNRIADAVTQRLLDHVRVETEQAPW